MPGSGDGLEVSDDGLACGGLTLTDGPLRGLKGGEGDARVAQRGEVSVRPRGEPSPEELGGRELQRVAA